MDFPYQPAIINQLLGCWGQSDPHFAAPRRSSFSPPPQPMGRSLNKIIDSENATAVFLLHLPLFSG